MLTRLKRELDEFVTLLKSVPPVTVAIFTVSLIAMNLLANKSVDMPTELGRYLALDCGFLVSWGAFLAMDVLTKHYGPKAATELSIFALILNLLCAFLFFLGSVVPGNWSASFDSGNVDGVNTALDYTFRGSWYVVFGSALAFAISAFVNNFLNFGIGKLFKKNPDGALAYYTRSYVSTAVGQFADNLVFAITVSYVFFGWDVLQCFMCAVTGMIIELLCEALFSPIGYALCKKWKHTGVGKTYLALVEQNKTDEILQ